MIPRKMQNPMVMTPLFSVQFAPRYGRGGNPFILPKNVMCGGAVYAGIGSMKMSKEDFDAGTSTFIGPHKAYASRQVVRRVNQQIPHHLKHHKYLVIGKLEDVENPDLVMFVSEAHKIMRLCKV